MTNFRYPKTKPPEPLMVREEAAVYRVNARLDAAMNEKLQSLAEATGLSTSDVLREAVQRMHDQLGAERARKRGRLSGLVGKYTGGPEDLSENYKRHLTASLGAKHRHA